MPPPIGHKNYNILGEGRPKTYTKEFIDDLAIKFEEWIQTETNIFFKDFALSHGLLPDILADFARDNDNFARVYLVAKEIQESKLLNGVLMKGYNNGIATLVLTNKHGYVSSKNETKVSGDSTNPLEFIINNAKPSHDLINGKEDN